MANPSPTPLERAILATVAYYDLTDYPLRPEEIWQWLYVAHDRDRASVAASARDDVRAALNTPWLRSRLAQRDGLVMLRGRDHLAEIRRSRVAPNERKWQRVRRATSVLRFLPFVRMVAVVNTLAINNAKPRSDADVLIVLRDGRLWLGRLIVTLVLQLLRWRHHGRAVQDRVCLSFFLTESHLDVGEFRLEGGDPYLAFWVTQAVPVFDTGGVYDRFRMANTWARQIIPHGFTDPRAVVRDAAFPRIVRRAKERLLGSRFGDWLERTVRRPQEWVIRRNVAVQSAVVGSDVVISDQVLKLHLTDRRRWFRDEFQRRCQQVVSVAPPRS